MKRHLSIAIIGCGVGGMSAAAFLTRQGHKVTLFEKFETPKPVGAGLLLQPTGLACLAALGLDGKTIQCGAVINHLYGKTDTGREIFNICYQDLSQNYFGVGISRAALFHLLFEEVQRLGIPIEVHCEVSTSTIEADKRIITTVKGRYFGPYDLVIDASGRNSRLRPEHLIKLNRPYPYGAIWGLLDDPGQKFGRDCLQQRYRGAHIMVGMLAIGSGADTQDKAIKKCTFFWSLPPGGYEQWLQQGVDKWKMTVSQYWPELSTLLSQFKTSDDLIYAQYSDIILKQWHDERLVFIGDAGHNSSPQLGQGANMALVDALILSELLTKHDDLNTALNAYSSARKSHINFYQFASRALTPFFQSDSRLFAWLRDNSFAKMAQIPLMKKEMLKTLSGVKTGLFSSLNPGDWHL